MSNSNLDGGVYGIDEIMVEILSRLPPKSLMRFKCVRKSWLSLIQKDKHFISLHSCRRRSNSNKKILIQSQWKRNRFFTVDLFKRGIEDVTTIPSEWEGKRIVGPVNGLLCFVNGGPRGCKASVLIYNLCTKEASPWIKSNIWYNDPGLLYSTIGFGFDPVTQQHKVLLVWWMNRNKKYGAEVLTVGENTWRTIHQVPPVRSFGCTSPTYLNGSIYWLICNPHGGDGLDNIIAFHVGKEKFRLINPPPPDGMRYNRFKYESSLEVDGQLAIMERMEYDDQKKVTEMRVWTYNIDQGDENNYKWIFREMIELPFCLGKYELRFIESIPGKDLFMITSSIMDMREPPFIYFYDMKKKKLSEYGNLPWPEDKSIVDFYLLVLEESIYPVGAQAGYHRD